MRTIGPARPAHAVYLAPKLRGVDRYELLAWTSYKDPTPALLDCLRVDESANSIFGDGRTIGIFGCTPVPGGWATPWLLGSEELGRKPKWLVETGRYFVKLWTKEYRYLENWCLATNTASINWLSRLGFKFQHTTIDKHQNKWVSFYLDKEMLHV